MMTPERYKAVGQLYRAALELAPEQRAAFLAEACGADEALRQEIESLLGYQAQSEGLIDQPALELAARALAAEPPRSLVSQQVAHYQILSLLGAGGMGEVYLAADTRLVDCSVNF
jgi:serine/threonine-protein kinase